jgi:hypothetical protein
MPIIFKHHLAPHWRAAMSAQFQPSSQQQYQSGLAQAELLEAMDRLKHEGFDWRVILSGAFGATAHLVAAHAGIHRSRFASRDGRQRPCTWPRSLDVFRLLCYMLRVEARLSASFDHRQRGCPRHR